MRDLIVIGGAPGSGKSTVAAHLQPRLGSPLFEFGWIPEFRFTGEEHIGHREEEALAFENLCLVLTNYLRHGFRNIIVTDLREDHVAQLRSTFADRDLVLVTLRVADEATLRRRVLDPSRSSAYRDAEAAVVLNAGHHRRAPVVGEHFVDVGERSIDDVTDEVQAWAEVP